MASYKIPESGKALQDFVDDLSNWYVRRSRERFWAKGMEQDKINAYMTLYTCLVNISKLAAPMIPFMTEEIYQNLLCSIDPKLRKVFICAIIRRRMKSMIDPELESNMDHVLEIVVLGRARPEMKALSRTVSRLPG